MADKQKTIQKKISLKGIGLHTGNTVTVTLKPAECSTGIRFIRVDLAGAPVIKAEFDNVLVDERLPRCTSIGLSSETAVHTVEHFMSVLCGLQIDNLEVEIDGNEVPGLDGSGIEFLEAIKKAGIRTQDADRQYCDITEPIWVERNGASIYLVPAADYRISYTLDYNHRALRSQFFSMMMQSDIFEQEVAACRTFCLEDEAKALRANELGKGATYNNTLVIGEDGVIDNTVRFENEFARHKVMDFIGDLYLLGMPIRGHAVAVKSGHTLNLELLGRINEYKKRYEQCGSVGSYTVSGAQTLDIDGIMKVLPHRFPFLLIDRVAELKPGQRAVAVKNVTVNEPFFNGHFPTRPVMPGVLMVEALAQAGGVALLTSEKNRGKVALFMGAHNVKFRKVVNPGDQLILEVEVLRDKTRSAYIRGVARVDDAIVTEAELLFSYADDDFLRP